MFKLNGTDLFNQKIVIYPKKVIKMIPIKNLNKCKYHKNLIKKVNSKNNSNNNSYNNNNRHNNLKQTSKKKNCNNNKKKIKDKKRNGIFLVRKNENLKIYQQKYFCHNKKILIKQ